MVNTLVATPEFERSNERERMEIEMKFGVKNTDFFTELLADVEPVTIDQVYLSHPTEPFSLRLRRILSSDGAVTYSADLKDRGEITTSGLARLETPTDISAETFQYYSSLPESVSLSKVRFEPTPGISIDWIEGLQGGPIVEVEDIDKHPESQDYYRMIESQLVNHTADETFTNEFIAHQLSGQSPERKPSMLDAGNIANEIMAHFGTGKNKLVVTIVGRSGSGKSTIAQNVRSILMEHLLETPVAILSTDDYHKGLTFLRSALGRDLTNWDEPIVYDTRALAFDIWQLQRGGEISQRYFDFRTQETRDCGIVQPANIVIVEGIMANSQDLDRVRGLHFDLQTPFATCVGRDLSRIRSNSRSNSSIGSISDRLRYQLEVAEPTYRDLARDIRNSWSASTRMLGFMAIDNA